MLFQLLKQIWLFLWLQSSCCHHWLQHCCYCVVIVLLLLLRCTSSSFAVIHNYVTATIAHNAEQLASSFKIVYTKTCLLFFILSWHTITRSSPPLLPLSFLPKHLPSGRGCLGDVRRSVRSDLVSWCRKVGRSERCLLCLDWLLVSESHCPVLLCHHKDFSGKKQLRTKTNRLPSPLVCFFTHLIWSGRHVQQLSSDTTSESSTCKLIKVRRWLIKEKSTLNGNFYFLSTLF